MSYRLPALSRALQPGSRPRLVSLGVVAVTALIATMLTVVPGAASASTSNDCAMRAHAYATRVRLGQLIRSHPTANLTLCTNRIDVTRRLQTVGANLPNVLETGAVTSRILTRQALSGQSHRITAQTHTARLVLLGKIHARAVVARATASTRRFHRLVGRTFILGLTLGGKHIPIHPKRDQTIALPGLGKIVLNHQVRIRHAHRITIRVTALRLVLGAGNKAHLPAGVIVVGHTVASVRVHIHR
jgi:hypothetical protein